MRKAADFILLNNNFHILTHEKPDPDTLGSALALCKAINKLGKKACVVCPDKIPLKYQFITGVEELKKVFDCDAVISVDIAALSLLGLLRETYENKIDLCIDHHEYSGGFAKIDVLDKNAAATGEIIYELINVLNVPFDDEMAAWIYTAISGDTGCFKYSNTTSKTHLIASELLKYNFSAHDINFELFTKKSRKRIEIEKLCFENIEFYNNDKIAVIGITYEMIKNIGADDSDIDELSSLAKSIEGVSVGISLKEKSEGGYRVSMRSDEAVDVSIICKSLGGGGHKRAAACSVAEKDLNKATDIVLKVILGD